MDHLPLDTGSRRRRSRSIASSTSPEPSRSSARHTPDLHKRARKRARTEEDSQGDNVDGRAGQSYNHSSAKGSARAHFGNHYGDVVHHNHLASDGLASQQNGNQDKRDTIAQALESLAFDQMEVRRDTISKAYSNTCEWLFSKIEFLNWRDPAMMPEHYGFFWIKSKPGAGKSTLMKFLFKTADRQLPEDKVISFFFHARGEALERSLEGLYRSLLHQLLMTSPRLQEYLKMPRDTESRQQIWSLETLKATFTEAVMGLGQDRLTCLIDALDECPEAEIRDLIEFFEELGESASNKKIEFRVCFSSRHYPHVTMEKCQHMLLDGQEGHEQDIAKFVKSKLKVRKDKTGESLRDAVQNKAQGVFMWVVLVVRILNEERDRGGNNTSLRKCLDRIPSELHKLFEDILQRGMRDDQNLVPILQWISFARRPLACEELYFAVRSDQADFAIAEPWDPDEDDPETMKLFILNSSKGLAELTRGKKPTVQFIHESVRDYLRDTGFKVLAHELNMNLLGLTHEHLKLCCYRWMDDHVINRLDLPRVLPKARSDEAKELRGCASTLFPFLDYAVTSSLHHAELACTHGVPQAAFVSSFALDRWRSINNVFAIYDNRRYMTESLMHILSDKNTTNLLVLELQARKSKVYFDQSKEFDYVLQLALAGSDLEVLAVLLNENFSLGQPKIQTMKTAVVMRNTEALRSLFTRRSWITSRECDDLVSASSGTGSIEVIQCVLQGISTVCPPLLTGATTFKTPEIFASSVDRGEVATVQMLLGFSRFYANIKSVIQESLPDAIKLGHEEIVKSLIEDPAAVDPLGDSISNALIMASEYGQNEIVLMLLQHSAVVNFQEHVLFTALGQACLNNRVIVVRTLLENGAEVNLSSENGSDAVVHPIFPYGAMDNAVDEWEQMALDLPYFNGVDANLESGLLGTPLTLACQNGHEKVVTLLLSRGADVNARPRLTFTPLGEACLNGHSTIVRLLLEGGADIDIWRNPSEAPIFLACLRRHGTALRMLLEHSSNFGLTVSSPTPGFAASDPQRLATFRGSREIENALRSHGVRSRRDDEIGNMLRVCGVILEEDTAIENEISSTVAKYCSSSG